MNGFVVGFGNGMLFIKTDNFQATS